MLLAFRKGEVDLMLVKGIWYLAVVCDVPDPEEIGITDVLGIDLGVVNLAVDSVGTVYSGAIVEQHRRIYSHRRRNLQRNGTRSARRKAAADQRQTSQVSKERESPHRQSHRPNGATQRVGHCSGSLAGHPYPD